jgi:hypothetical protein
MDIMRFIIYRYELHKSMSSMTVTFLRLVIENHERMRVGGSMSEVNTMDHA